MNIKHERSDVSISAGVSVELWLLITVRLNGDDIYDRPAIKAKYLEDLLLIYGDKYSFGNTYRHVINLIEGNTLGVSSRSLYTKFANSIHKL